MANNPKHKDNLVNFKKGQSGNPNGRPRKTFRVINEQLKDGGIEPLTRGQLIEAYSLIFNSTEKELKDLAKNSETPYAMRLIIGELNSSRTRSKALQDYRDYMFGKAQDKVDLTTNGKDINIINLGAGTKPTE